MTNVIGAGFDQGSWNDQQQRYWSPLAPAYDGFYESAWSQLENEWVAARLQFLQHMSSPRILDLGCGTGLGARLVSRWADLDGYLGVDISPEMARITAYRYHVATRVASMDALTWVPDGSVDAVIVLFSAASFSPSLRRLVHEISRVLRPGGHVYLSTLGRNLRRTPRDTSFRTRGKRISRSSVPTHRFRAEHLRDAAREAGLVQIGVHGMNAFAGLVEMRAVWGLGRWLAERWPGTSHLLELRCAKPSPSTFEENS